MQSVWATVCICHVIHICVYVYTLSMTDLHYSSLIGAVLSRFFVLGELILCFTSQTGQKEGKIKTEEDQGGESIKRDNADECHH